MPGKEHNELTSMAACWLNNRATGKGVRGASEVWLDHGYVADYAALVSFQGRFDQAYRYDSGLARKNLMQTISIGGGESVMFDDDSSDVPNYYACIFEAKATRSDFLSTFNNSEKHSNRKYPIGSFHWVVANKGIVNPDEVPDFWGVLEKYGAGLREVKKPKINILQSCDIDSIAHRIIWPMKSVRDSDWDVRIKMEERVRYARIAIRRGRDSEHVLKILNGKYGVDDV